MQCPSCHADVADGARFCSSCGQELARREDERRVVTVLFADIVGFTGLSETRDPEQVKNLVDRCFALLADDITAFGGRVDKVVGDAIVALFGAPIAHDDDAERAVRAALRMQETVSRYDDETGVGIRLRIGVNTGEVLVGALVAGDDYTAMGDVVNTASRLQTAAEPGTVVVGTVTHEATEEYIRYRSIGQLHARGREEPVTAYRALAPYGRPGERRTSPDLPFVGREAELELARVAMHNAFTTGRGLLLSITGDAGVGKSRVARELTDLARFEHGAAVMHGRCLPYGETNPWWPLAEIVRSAAALDPDLDDTETRATVLEVVQRILGARAAELDADRVTDGVLHLLGVDTPLSRLPAERATAEVTRSARVILGAFSRATPMILWLSDIQFADPEVLGLVDELLDRLGRRPVVVLVTATSSVFDHWNPRPTRWNLLSLALDRLDDDAMRRIVQGIGGDLDEATREALVSRADGNPRFLEEMARVAVVDAEAVRSLPTNVRSVISARLDALDDRARSVLGDAAVLGSRGDRESLRTMAAYTHANETDLDVDAAVADLQRADLLDVTARSWAFRSNVVRDVVYDRLTKSQRAWRHAGVAMWLELNEPTETDTIAWHYRRTADLVAEVGGVEGLDDDFDAKAIDFTIRALREHRGQWSSSRVRELQTAALRLLADDDERRAPLLLERAHTSARALRLDDAVADLTAADAVMGVDATLELRLRRELVASEIAQWADDHPEARARADAAMAIAADLDDPATTAETLRRRGMVDLFDGEYDSADRSISAALEEFARVGDEVGMAWAHQNLAWISFVGGRMAEAEVRLLAASDAFTRAGDLAGRAWSAGLLAFVRIYDGRFAEADELARSTLADAREQGDRWGQGMMHVALAASALWSGDVDRSLAQTESAMGCFPEGTDSMGLAQAVAARARALVRAGRPDQGFGLLDRSLVELPSGPANEMLRTAMMAAAANIGDIDRVVGIDALSEPRDAEVLGEAERRISRSLTSLQQADLDGAEAALEGLVAPGEPGGSSWGWAVEALIAAARGRPVGDIVDAVEVSRRSTYSDRVLARLAVAAAAARAGDAAATDVALDRARAAVPPGGDQLSPAIIAVADAVFAEALLRADATERSTAARDALDRIGASESGWWTALEMTVAPSVVV